LDTLNCTTISITGHSLGGAIAALATYELSFSHYFINRMYTYGQPCVGNKDWVISFTSRLNLLNISQFRIVNNKDAVPHMLPSWSGWVHSGPEIYYYVPTLGKYVVCSDSKDIRCSFQWNLFQTLSHTCDHCSYLGMNPRECEKTEPQCTES
jgi:hypothetical protein